MKLISRQPGSVVRFIDSSSDEVLLQIGVDEKGGISVGYRLRDRFHAATRTITWELDPSFESTLRHVSGYWELHALDAERTLARFGTKVSVSAAVPGFLQNGITRKNVPDSLENTRQWVDSGGRWRP